MSILYKSNYVQLTDHESRISANETSISNNASDIGTLQTDLSSVQTTVASHTASIATNAADIDTNAADILSLQLSISSLKRAIVAIGNWDMDTDSSFNVAHGLTAANIRAISGFVVNDLEDTWYPINGMYDSSTGDNIQIGIEFWGSTNVAISRNVGSIFNSTDFDSIAINRGYLIIDYV